MSGSKSNTMEVFQHREESWKNEALRRFLYIIRGVGYPDATNPACLIYLPTKGEKTKKETEEIKSPKSTLNEMM